MLNSLDTLIGFVVIMTLLSLLITVCTQMISSLLAMRGKNLANALAVTLRTIDPDIGHQAEEVVAHLLSRPGISDSIFSSTLPRFAANSANSSDQTAAAERLMDAEEEARSTQANLDSAAERIAGLEAALVKAETAVTTASKEGLSAAQQARDQCRRDVRLGAQALAAARVAARHPALRAAAARAAVPATTATPASDGGRAWNIWKPGGFGLTDAVRPDEVYRLLHEMASHTPAQAVASGLSAFTPWKVARLLERVKTPVATDQEAAGKVAATLQLLDANGLLKEGDELLTRLDRFDKAVETATAQGYDRFERWFNTTSDRAQQWFTTHARVATVVSAILLAFGLQLDLKEIYHSISTDPSMRTALVNSASEVIKQANSILPKPTPAANGSPASAAQDHPVAGQSTPPANADTAGLADANAKYRALTDTIKASAYDIIPPNGWRWTDPSDCYWYHFFGMAMMAALLSIGAPFWFNILASLANLRPSIAQVVQDRPTQSSKPPPDPGKK